MEIGYGFSPRHGYYRRADQLEDHHFASISGSEEFIAQLVMEMPELVDASIIYDEEREKLKEAILIVSMEGLMPAFELLKKIRASVGRRCPS